MRRVIRAKVVGAALCLLLMGTAASVMAYSVSLTNGDSGEIVRWPSSTLTYYLHPNCSEDLPTDLCLDTLRESFAAWTGHGCSAMTWNELGLSNNLSLTAIGGGSNGKNELGFIEGSSWTYGAYVLGVTGPIFGFDGYIIEADIAFNGREHTWTTEGQYNSTDVMNVAVHEIGHFFGLNHVLNGYSASDPPTMAPAADPNMATRTPEADDIAGLCFLYAADGHACASDDDCPWVVDQQAMGEVYVGKLACEGGLCGGVSYDLPSGEGQLGETCSQDYDCEEPLFCDKSPFGGGICAQSCSSSLDCPEEYECKGGVCRSESEDGGQLSEGDPCSGQWSCPLPLVCHAGENGSYCRQACASFLPCPDGYECDVSGFFGGCLPLGGGAEFGAPCAAAGDCATGLCEEGVCSDICDIFDGPSACDGILGCMREYPDISSGLCVPRGDGNPGEACERDLACEGLLCHEEICREVCDPTDPNWQCSDDTLLCEVAEGEVGYCPAVTDGSRFMPPQVSSRGDCSTGTPMPWLWGVLLCFGWIIRLRKSRLA